jgi:hypothetical protein
MLERNENKVFIVGNNKGRIDSVISNLHGVDPENIEVIDIDQLLAIDEFKRNIVIVTEQLSEIEGIKLGDKFAEIEDVVVVDLRDNFAGLPIYDETIYLPEITAEHGQKIVHRQWDELKHTSDINKFEKFKHQEVKVRKYEKVHYEEIEQELDQLKVKVEEHDGIVADLNRQIAGLNEELDRKAEEVRSKSRHIEKLEARIQQKDEETARERRKLKDEIREYQEREEKHKRIINEASKKYDLVGFGGGHNLEERKRKLVREAREQGRKVVGIVGNGKYFVEKAIEGNEDFVVVQEPEKADFWIIVTTPDKDSVEQFKELIMGKPLSKSLKVMTLWNDGYPFTPESLAESDFDLVIPYHSEFFQLDWLDERPGANWKIELNNLLERELS